jgi:hypothetical protein
MGWEVIHDKDLGYAVIMCNTMNTAHNPVFRPNEDFNKSLFYSWWDKMRLQDPRQMDSDYRQSAWEKFDLFCSEPVIKLKFNRQGEVSEIITVHFDSDGDLFIPYLEGFDEEEYESLDEMEIAIRTSVFQGIWCGQFEHHNNSLWSLTAVKAYRGYVPLNSALMFPKTLPNHESVMKEALEIHQS